MSEISLQEEREDYGYLSEAKSFEDMKKRLERLDNHKKFHYALNTKAAEKFMRKSEFIKPNGKIDIKLYIDAIDYLKSVPDSEYNRDDYILDCMLADAYDEGVEELFSDTQGFVGKTLASPVRKFNRRSKESFKSLSRPDDGSIMAGIIWLKNWVVRKINELKR
ncbi:hypothetical protein [Mammaliicoccus sp. E-M21]|uniref:hypothetical protein n=1 Tax=Mammaliicoccus sp. E-M21 TaxID=2898681 RepID=UPI001EFADBC9|nr:hypothetical protein [Mammaliicoccus sp. E-M21]